MPAAGAAGPRGLRAMTLVERLARAGAVGEATLTVADCIAAASIPRASCHRLLRALVASGYAQRVGRGRYAPGWRLLALGRDIGTGIMALAGAPLRRLVEVTGQTAHVGVLDGVEAVYVDCVDSPDSLRLAARPGSRIQLNASAIGMAIAAFLPRAELECLVHSTPWARRTTRTLTEPGRILAALDAVRRRGFAVDDGGYAEHVRCIAAPVRARDGRVVAAVGVTGLAADFDPLAAAVVAAIVEAGADISRRLGGWGERTDAIPLAGGRPPPAPAGADTATFRGSGRGSQFGRGGRGRESMGYTDAELEVSVGSEEDARGGPGDQTGQVDSAHHVSRRRAIALGGVAAITGALGTVLAGCGPGAARSSTPSTANGGAPVTTSSTGGASEAAPAAVVPNLGLYSGPTVPSTYSATLGVTVAGSIGTPPTVGPATWIKSGQIDLSALFNASSVGNLQPALALAAWNQKHPKVTFKTYPALWSGADGGMAPLLTQLAGGTAPDVFPAYGDNPGPYVAQNALADLTPYVDRWPEWSGAPASLRGTATVGGKIYAIPTNAPSGYVVVYRRDLFKAAGVPEPTADWTTDDYLSIATKMSNPSKKQWGTNLLWQYTNWYFGEICQCLGVPAAGYFFLVPDATGTKFDIAPIPEAARALGYYQAFVKNKAALYGSSETYGVTSNNDLIAGRAAMIIRQTKSLNGLLSSVGQPGALSLSQMGIVPMPQGPEGTRNYDIGANFYSVNGTNTGDKLTLAWEFLKDMIGPRGTELEYAVNGLSGTLPQLPPAYPGTALPVAISALFPQSWLQTITGADVLGVPLPPNPSDYKIPNPPPYTARGWDAYIQEAMLNPTKDPTTIAQALKNHMDTAVNNTPVQGLNKSVWHGYYRALGKYFQTKYPKYYAGTYTKYYKRFETF